VLKAVQNTSSDAGPFELFDRQKVGICHTNGNHFPRVSISVWNFTNLSEKVHSLVKKSMEFSEVFVFIGSKMKPNFLIRTNGKISTQNIVDTELNLAILCYNKNNSSNEII
jgi:hypothetical protein